MSEEDPLFTILEIVEQQQRSIAAEAAALEGELVMMQKRADDLTSKGGKVKFTVCGDQKRRCVKVNRLAGIFGDTSDYMILDGY